MTKATARTSIGLPAERHHQLKKIAAARGLTTTGLIEAWIARAVEDGEISDHLAGYTALWDDDALFVEIAGNPLPMMPAQRARVLLAVLDGAAGKVDSNTEFKLPIGKAVEVDLGAAKLGVGRYGRGVVFVLTSTATGEQKKFSAPPSYIGDLTRQMRAELRLH